MTDNPMVTVCRAIVDPAMTDKFKSVLPASVSLDRFTRVTITAIQQNPAVLDADRNSLYNACVNAASRGLMPDGKEGVLSVFNTKQGDQWVKKVQFMPMVEGIVKEMAKAGVKAYAVSVYANDEIDFWNDETGQHVKHKPIVFGDRGERIGALAVATDTDGRTYVEAMNRDELARVMAKSKSKDREGNPTGPWKDSPERMEQKTVLHRVRKRVPIIGHDDIVERMQEDDALDYEPEQQPTPAPAPEPVVEKPKANGKRPKGLQAVVDQAQSQESEPPPPDDNEVF